MRDLLVEPAATEDLAQAIAYYDSEKEGLGLEFATDVKDLIWRIAANPRIYAPFHEHSRKAVMSRFPYVILYQFNDEAVFVLGVIHGRRNPRIMAARIKRRRN